MFKVRNGGGSDNGQLGKSKYALEEHFSVYINDVPLDAFLENKLNDDGVYEGMVSAWLLDWHDEFNDSQEKDYVIKQSKLESSTKVLPILLCSDDFDFFCW